MTKIRLSQYDRLQALVRNAQYQEDYNRYSRGKVSSEECQKLIEKWEVPYLFDPQEVKKWWWFEEAHQEAAFFPSHVKVIPHGKTKHYMIQGKKRLAVREEDLLARKASRKKKGLFHHQVDFTPHLEKGCYLTLKIDLWAKKEEILKEFEEKLDFYRSDAKPPKIRERKTTCDPWIIYDMYKGGKSLLSIAKELFGFKENPTYSPQAKAKYELVSAAYKKAVKMIELVNPTK